LPEHRSGGERLAWIAALLTWTPAKVPLHRVSACVVSNVDHRMVRSHGNQQLTLLQAHVPRRVKGNISKTQFEDKTGSGRQSPGPEVRGESGGEVGRCWFCW
jgi:hypothetical protein